MVDTSALGADAERCGGSSPFYRTLSGVMVKHFLSYLKESVVNYWDNPVVSDYDGGVTLSYGEFANQMNRIRVLFDLLGLQKGDKVALCGNNCSNWALSFMSVVSNENVAVTILPDFASDSIQSLVNHSDAKILIVSQRIWNNLDFGSMPYLQAVLSMKDFSLLASRGREESYSQWEQVYSSRFPKGIKAEDIQYPTDNLDDLCLINYTSGTTSDPKGVMLSYRSISSNTQFGQDGIPTKEGSTIISMLPLAHMFGLAFELIYPMAGGCHIYFLNRTPSPQVLLKAMSEIKPYLLLTVPLVIEKIFRKSVFPIIHKPLMRVLWVIPGVGHIVRGIIRRKLIETFGGNVNPVIIGGAALSKDVEKCMKSIRFPYTVGYGMTECGPIIAYSNWRTFKKKSCGRLVDRMEIRIDSANPHKEVGEISVRGDNVMLGYYKNPEATQAVMKDGWMLTGDLGIIDKKGNIFIKGRSKTMILGPSGQNIYPEEIEDKLNTMPLVIESLVVQRDSHLVGLVYADVDGVRRQGLDEEGLVNLMEQNRLRLNKLLPVFCRLSSIELVEHEFEKTPKRSIKRFLYK